DPACAAIDPAAEHRRAVKDEQTRPRGSLPHRGDSRGSAAGELAAVVDADHRSADPGSPCAAPGAGPGALGRGGAAHECPLAGVVPEPIGWTARRAPDRSREWARTR